MERPQKFIYTLSSLIIVVAFTVARTQYGSVDLGIAYGVKWAALLGAFYLYLTLLIGPLYKVFVDLPGKSVAFSARKALGNSALVFAGIHSCLAFFGLLGGFSGWLFLGPLYLWATVSSLGALVIMLALFVVSVGRLAPKVFSRFPGFGKIGYLAGVLVLVHAFLIGSHFQNLSGSVPRVSFILIAVLVLLLGMEHDATSQKKVAAPRVAGWGALLAALVIGVCVPRFFISTGSGPLVANPHAQHLAAIQQTASAPRYSLSLQAPPQIAPGKEAAFQFVIYNADTGATITDFQLVHDKFAHLVIVNDALDYYSHIHPDLSAGGTFSIKTSFPKSDYYRLYLSVEPKGNVIESVFVNPISVGGGTSEAAHLSLDSQSPKQISSYRVSLSAGGTISAADAAAGNAKIVFRIADAKSEPVTTLYPYLAAFGHLVMIRGGDYSYIHIHPKLVPFSPEETSGPEVEFAVLGNLKPGLYKVFGQFAPNKELITVPFTIEVKP